MTDARMAQFDNPALAELSDIGRAQTIQTINSVLLGEIVDAVGGEVVLPPGFAERVGSPLRLLVTRFLDDGSYRVWTEPLPDEHNHAGAGTLWERQTGPLKRPEREVFEVVDVEQHGLATLRRVDPATGAPLAGKLLVSLEHDRLRRGVGGWRRFIPSREFVETEAGQPA